MSLIYHLNTKSSTTLDAQRWRIKFV